MTRAHYQPDGWPVLIPRIVADAPELLVGFVKDVFKATGSFNPERPSELRIGDSMLMISAPTARDRMPAFLYIYVEDADLTYRHALDKGATSVEEPRDLPYGDRRAMIRDRWGNTWQIATHKGAFHGSR
jgi:PhnB protein